jgi:hypothetical protein
MKVNKHILKLLAVLLLNACYYSKEADLKYLLYDTEIEMIKADMSTTRYDTLQLLSLLYADEFDNPSASEWKTSGNSYINSEIKNGELLLTAQSGRSPYTVKNLPNVNWLQDFQFEIKLKSATDSIGYQNGLIFAVNEKANHARYIFSLFNTNDYYPRLEIGYRNKDDIIEDKDYYHSICYYNPEEYHVFTIRKLGDSLSFFIDRQYKYTLKYEANRALPICYGFHLIGGETLTLDYIRVHAISQAEAVVIDPVEFGNIALTDADYKSLTLKSSITDIKDNTVTDIGFCYSVNNAEPTIMDDILLAGQYGNNSLQGKLTLLQPDTKYYVRAYAMCNNSTSVSYSAVAEFNTLALPNNSGLQITKLEFGNIDANDNMLNNYGASLSASSMRFLVMRITYNALSIEPQEVTLNVKIVRPNGTMMQVSGAPEGFSFDRKFTTEGDYTEKIVHELGGLGSGSSSVFTAGTYPVEIWSSQGEKLYQTNLTIK